MSPSRTIHNITRIIPDCSLTLPISFLYLLHVGRVIHQGTRQKEQTMATMHYVVIITKDGAIVERYPAPTKSSAGKRGRKIAAEINGELTIEAIAPIEYNPSDWM